MKKIIPRDPKIGLYRHIYFIYHGLIKGLKDVLKPVKPARKEKIVIDPKQIKVWMIGHASVLINFYGVTIVTDPVFVNWLPLPKRIMAAGYLAKDLPPLDYVLVSHAHFDHLNLKSLRQLSRKAKTLIVPKNCLNIVKKIRFKNKVELSWEQPQNFGNLEIFAYKPRHTGWRWPWERIKRQYHCYVLKRNGVSIFFGADSGYGEHYKQIAEDHQIKLAFLGIGAYEPYHALRLVHMNPHDALKAFFDLAAEYFVPIHFGNFRLGFEPINDPPRILKELRKNHNLETQIHILENGEVLNLD